MLIYVLRHCESAVMRWRMQNPDAEIVAPQYVPDSSVPISEDLGQAQRHALALYFASLPEDEQPDVAFGSPFRRTVQTGEGALSLMPKTVPLVTDNRLREIDFGIFDGLTKKGRAAKFPALWEERRQVGKINFRPEGGENWHDIACRFRSFQSDKIETLPPASRVLVSTHENLVSVSQWLWGGEDVNELSRQGVPSASISVYEFDGKSFKLKRKNFLPPSPTGRDLFSMEAKGQYA